MAVMSTSSGRRRGSSPKLPASVVGHSTRNMTSFIFSMGSMTCSPAPSAKDSSSSLTMCSRSSWSTSTFADRMVSTYWDADLISRAGTSAPFARAKPSAALVGTPFSPKAESSPGPRCTFWRAVCSSGKSLIKRAMRRGDTRTWILSPTTSRSAEENREAALPGKRLAAARQAEAGSSSVPTSSKKSLGTSRLLQLSYVPLGYTPGKITDARNVPRPLRDTYCSPCFQEIEAVRTLQDEVICWPNQPMIQTTAALLLRIGKIPLQSGYIRHVKTVCRPLRLVLAMHIPVRHPWRPFQIESAVDALQIHGYPLRTICEFDADGVQIYAPYLLEIGELRDLHPVYPNLPASAPGPQGGRLPILFHKPDIMLVQLDAQMLERLQVQVLDIIRSWFQNDLILVIMAETVWVLSVTPICRPDRRLNIGYVPWVGAEGAQKRGGIEGPGANLSMIGLPYNTTPFSPEMFKTQENILKCLAFHIRDNLCHRGHEGLIVTEQPRSPYRRKVDGRKRQVKERKPWISES